MCVVVGGDSCCGVCGVCVGTECGADIECGGVYGVVDCVVALLLCMMVVLSWLVSVVCWWC